jgi:nicotinate-nucleotide--dimethylbenzimidazole phosphoribosyltransferase
LLDGFIATSAAIVLNAMNPELVANMMAAHTSQEGAHGKMLSALGMTPLLDLNMRLGEGSGAALALQIVRAAVACHAGMATFAEAGVSDG